MLKPKSLTYRNVSNSHCYWFIVNHACKLQELSPYTMWQQITQTELNTLPTRWSFN